MNSVRENRSKQIVLFLNFYRSKQIVYAADSFSFSLFSFSLSFISLSLFLNCYLSLFLNCTLTPWQHLALRSYCFSLFISFNLSSSSLSFNQLCPSYLYIIFKRHTDLILIMFCFAASF